MWGELRYTLDQHAPLLHFQLEDDGLMHWEGLRPTEVRSKLVSWINTFCRRNNIAICCAKQVQDRGLSETLRGKSNIKVKVYVEDPRDNQVENYSASLFDNIRPGCTAANTRLIIQDFHQKITFHGGALPAVMGKNGCTLLEMIDFVLPYFFRFTGFGFRSTKGYGCFSVRGRTADPGLEGYFLPREMPFYYRIPRKTDAGEKLEYIAELYGLIVNAYKTNYERKCPNTDLEKCPNTDLARSRIYLGMRYKINESQIRSESVRRFASPLQFRITPDEVLLIPRPIPREILKLHDLEMGGTTLQGSRFYLDKFLDQFWETPDGKSQMAVKVSCRKEGKPCTT